MTTRRSFLGAFAAAGLRGAGATPPNIVFVLTDDQRWDAMSCAGHPFLKTPNIDRIASEGARFRNAFVTTPLCSPSRASFLTGRYVHSHGVTGNGNNNALSHELNTFPRLLQRAGYETAFIGKWHMGNDDTPRPGFNRWVSFRGQGVYENPELNVDGKQARAEGYMTDLLTGHAVDFIRRKRTAPFLLYLPHKAVHGPFTPAERHRNLFAGQSIRRAPNAADTLEGKPALTRKVNERQRPGITGPGGPSDETILNQLRALMAVDDSVGQVFQALEERRALDNTVVIFASDNGYFWGEHKLGDKRAAYEESIRVPLLVRYPKLVRAGTIIEDSALNVDIAPTALALAGVPAPKEMHGRSLLPLFGNKPRNWRKSFLAEYFAEAGFPRVPSWQAARTDRWKYVHYTDLDGVDELYDLKTDPYEMKNVIGEPAAATALRDMKTELARLLAETR